jgi:hypothetical protein
MSGFGIAIDVAQAHGIEDDYASASLYAAYEKLTFQGYPAAHVVAIANTENVSCDTLVGINNTTYLQASVDDWMLGKPCDYSDKLAALALSTLTGS